MAPKLYTEYRLETLKSPDDLELGNLGAAVPAGAPVFGVQGLDALMLGGQWCALPNDTLARVAAYAPRTGVRWVVVRADRNALMEISLYSAEGASRYKRLAQYGPRPAESGLVRLSATTPEGETWLYEFTVSATR